MNKWTFCHEFLLFIYKNICANYREKEREKIGYQRFVFIEDTTAASIESDLSRSIKSIISIFILQTNSGFTSISRNVSKTLN